MYGVSCGMYISLKLLAVSVIGPPACFCFLLLFLLFHVCIFFLCGGGGHTHGDVVENEYVRKCPKGHVSY